MAELVETRPRRYRFKGWGWEELAECWGIRLHEADLRAYFPTPELWSRMEAMLEPRSVNGGRYFALLSHEESMAQDPEIQTLLDQHSSEEERIFGANLCAVRARLHEAMREHGPSLFADTVKDVRRFVRAMVRGSFDDKGKPLLGDAPIWKALLQCDDCSLLQLTDTLLPHMWT